MRSLGLLVMRVTAGLLFAAHGYAKLFGGEGKSVHATAQRHLGEGFVQAVARGGPTNFSRGLARMGVPAPGLMAFVVGATEFVGGLMLISGVLTRLAALGLAVNMFFAIKLVHWKQGMIGSASGYMYAFSLLGSMVGLLFLGAGAASADHGARRWLRARRGSPGAEPLIGGRASASGAGGTIRVPQFESVPGGESLAVGGWLGADATGDNAPNSTGGSDGYQRQGRRRPGPARRCACP